MKSIKVYFGESDVRRFTSNLERWDDVVEMLRTIFGPSYHPELRVQYVDEDKDFITVSSDIEWQEALQFFERDSQNSIIRLYVKEGQNPQKYFRDGPAPEIVGIYQGEEKTPVETSELAFSVPRGLERLFPDGKILPYNLPTWLRGIKVVPAHDYTDIHIDFDKLLGSVFDHGLVLLNEGKNAKGKEMFEICVSIAPNHYLAFYNLACAQALLGESNQAIETLRVAIEKGYNNFDHLERDADLASLRNLAAFQALLPQAAPVNTQPEVVPMEEAPVEADSSAAVNEIVDSFSMIAEEQPQVAQIQTEPEQYASQLQQMDEMGFHDLAVNREMLRKTHGSIVEAIQAILGL